MEMTPASLLHLCSQAGLTHGCMEFLTDTMARTSSTFFSPIFQTASLILCLLYLCFFPGPFFCSISSDAQIVAFLKDLRL